MPTSKTLIPLRATIAVLAIIAGVIGIAIVTWPASPVQSNKLQVVAAENTWGNIASQIGGDRVQVTSILNDPSADPHLYESDARDAEAVARALVVIKNGLGYDDFIDRLLAGSGSLNQKIIVNAQSVNRASASANPHLWYDPTFAPVMAQAIETALAAKRPADSSYFKANLAKFDSAMASVNNAISAIRKSYADQPVAYTERVPGYLLSRAGLRVVTPSGFAMAIEEGSEPSPTDYETMQQIILERQTRVLIYNQQTTSTATAHLRTMAHVAGVPVVGMTEMLPPHDSYQTWQLNQINALQAALRQP